MIDWSSTVNAPSHHEVLPPPKQEKIVWEMFSHAREEWVTEKSLIKAPDNTESRSVFLLYTDVCTSLWNFRIARNI